MVNTLRLVVCLSVAIMPVQSLAQSNAGTIAATLQSWRDACSDPNPDLALGYLIDAVATNSTDVRKTCLRQVLLSDNVDLQNAAMRVVMTSIPVVRFRMTEEIKSRNGRINHVVQSIRAGLLFYSKDGDQTLGTATWQPIVDTPRPVETATGTMTVFGSDVHWVGTANYLGNDFACSLQATLTEGTRIVGSFICESADAIPIEASLFD